MKKFLLITCILSLISITPVQAETEKTRYEMLLEDVIFTFLDPLEDKAINDYFGEIKQSTFCKFIEVKRKPNMGYAYEITYQFQTFEGAHKPPYHLFTLTVENEKLTEWTLKDVIVERLDGKKIKCRKPLQVK
ncbi:DUF3888 domain-containing protein [Bacillus sp. V2I10]|uniref:DUF3888 domain-containing protein n=1 Tax=Bacillus sp. V2I10 TaxID=3042276 RepID=UPI0027887530|nr:DUF3888 domain-containing protein [Bacillus sp. V2I10]MDQ0862200.1 hypothetical protein [Bacillus sp. V2I10]